jgi:hypothetical protein
MLSPMPSFSPFEFRPLLLICSTLPHLFAVCFSPSPLYSGIVVAATAASVAWHAEEEPQNWLAVLDYSLAGAWFAADVAYGWGSFWLPFIVLLNLWIAALHRAAEDLVKSKIHSYEISHSAWHLVSAFRAVCIAYLLSAGHPMPS